MVVQKAHQFSVYTQPDDDDEIYYSTLREIFHPFKYISFPTHTDTAKECVVLIAVLGIITLKACSTTTSFHKKYNSLNHHIIYSRWVVTKKKKV